jgi:(2Fe-2S) ferredoxin
MTTKKGYTEMFCFLAMNIVNSHLTYVLVQELYSKRPLTHKMFKLNPLHIKNDLYEHQRPSDGLIDVRLNGEPHIIDRKEIRSVTCVMHTVKKLQKETIYCCKMCNEKPFLHMNKYSEWYHIVKNL